jgi:hypothetical protein
MLSILQFLLFIFDIPVQSILTPFLRLPAVATVSAGIPGVRGD